MSLAFNKTDNLRFSFIMYCYWTVLSAYLCEDLTWRNLEVSKFSFLRTSTKKKSLIRRIWDFKKVLLELRGGYFIELPSMLYCNVIILMRLSVPGLSQGLL